MLKHAPYLLLLLLAASACTTQQEQQQHATPSKSAVADVLDSWHQAAADADFDSYFSKMAPKSIFMGTDATEYWTKQEFKDFARPYFEGGQAWTFEAVDRNIYFSDNGKTAWFDESLDTPNLGPSRGTGVLIHTDSTWLITHYNLSVPIPNEIVDEVVDQIKAHHQQEKK